MKKSNRDTKKKILKIAFATGSRADYYLLRPLLRRLSKESWAEITLCLTGAQCMIGSGNSVEDIEKDGYYSNLEKIDLLLKQDNPIDVAHAFARGVSGFANFFKEESIDCFVAYGDRYEMLAAASAAMIMGKPIVHIGGGDVTVGAIDDSIRHAISKMAKLHFPISKDSARRLSLMGEDPKTIYPVGSLAIEEILTVERLSRNELEKDLGFTLCPKNILVTLHPETLSKISAKTQSKAVLQSLETLDTSNYFILFTGTNADFHGSHIRDEIFKFIKERKNARFIDNLGTKKYFNCLRHFDILLGNSSSGIVEAPYFGIPTVNIGDRQKGRLVGPTVVNCTFKAYSISKAIRSALKLKKGKVKFGSLPYGDGNSSEKIVKVLKTHAAKLNARTKIFFE